MVGLTAVSGCVVTDKISFHEPVNSPPGFAAVQPGDIQLGDHVFLEIGDVATWTFTFRMHDADIQQPLDAHWQVLRSMGGDDLSPVGERYEETGVPPSGNETRDFNIDIDRGQLAFDSCHRVDIAVSGSFAPPFDGPQRFLDRRDRFDITQFTFWVWEGEPNDNDWENLAKTCAPTLVEPAIPTGAAGQGAAQ